MKWIFLITLMIFGTPSFAQEVVSLRQAQERAAAQHWDVAIAESSVARAQLGRRQVRAQRLPRLDLSASYTHISETGGIDIALPGLPPRSISFGDGHVWESALTASVPLYTGSRLSALGDMAQLQVRMAEETLEGTKTALRHRAALLYRSAQLADRSARIFEAQIAWLGIQLEALKQMHAQGQVLSYDTLLLSTRRNALRVERAGADARKRNAMIDLGALIRQDADSFSIEEEIICDDLFAGAAGSLVLRQAAEAGRSELRLLRQQQQMQELRIGEVHATLLPSVNAFASLRYGRPGVDQVANEWMEYYTAGVSLHWNLWSWGGDRARIEQEEYGLRQSEERYGQLRSAIHASIDRILNDLAVLRSTRQLLGEQVRQEESKLHLVAARFGQGLATATEVVDAETALTAARLQTEQTEIQYAMKITELAAAIGRKE